MYQLLYKQIFLIYVKIVYNSVLDFIYKDKKFCDYFDLILANNFKIH